MNNSRPNAGFLIAVSVAATLLLCATTYAQNQDAANATTPAAVDAEIDKIFGWIAADCPGCAVALSQNGELIVNRVYGLADLERNVPITADSVFDAGSVRKQFIAAAILLLVEDGKLSLDDDVRQYITELPAYSPPGKPDAPYTITIGHLLTHTSGIRDWQPLLNLAGGDPDAMSMILRQRELNFAPGDEWSYSNSGYVLLPEIVERVSGTSFAEFARTRLFEPTGMKSTIWVDDPLSIIKHRALAYSKEGGDWKMDMYLGNDRGGAGALFTTARDLVAWNDALANNRLGKSVAEKLQEPTTLNNGRKLTYARALFVETRGNDRLIWHSGGAAGYSTLSVRLPDHGMSLAITCNQDGGARSELASRIFDLFLPPAPPEPSADGVAVSAEELSGRAGLYFEKQTGQPLRLGVNNNTLTILDGSPLVALAADRFKNRRVSAFFMSEAEIELQFLTDGEFEIKTAEGITTRYRRATEYAPTADDLRAFAGRYRSDELLAVFDFAVVGNNLMGQANERPGPPFPFKAVDRDTFQFARMTLRFVRDESGKVAGLEFSNPMLRNVKFARLSEGK